MVASGIFLLRVAVEAFVIGITADLTFLGVLDVIHARLSRFPLWMLPTMYIVIHGVLIGYHSSLKSSALAIRNLVLSTFLCECIVV